MHCFDDDHERLRDTIHGMDHRESIVLGKGVDPAKLDMARRLRQEMTPAERVFWKEVRRNQLDELHFRRQQIIGGFIVDFYCHKARLAVELDGKIHCEREDYDRRRDEIIRQHQILVLRFRNEDVLERIEEVLRRVRDISRTRVNQDR
jgi:very-short-patch-repair endonuclease